MSDDSSRQLRLIGQDLETLDLQDFKVEFDGNTYKVTGTAIMAPSEKPKPEAGLSRLWRSLTKQGVVTDQPRPTGFERTYTAQDLDNLKERVVDQRSETGDMKTAPDSYSASQILRVIGAFVEEKGGSFLGFARKGRMVEIDYLDSSGERCSEQQPFSSLFDFSTHMYRRRGE